MKPRADSSPTQKDSSAPYADAQWIRTINRLLGAEMRPDPRPKPGHHARLKYWNQTDLSEAAGIRGNTLSDIMKGKREPAIDSLNKIAKALGHPTFVFLMDATEAERYTMFREVKNAEDQAKAVHANAQQIARDVIGELGSQIVDMIEDRMSGKVPDHHDVKHSGRKRA